MKGRKNPKVNTGKGVRNALQVLCKKMACSKYRQQPEELKKSLRPDANPKNATSFCTGQRILLAEDNVMNREILQSILEEYGLEIEVVGNGKAAVERVLECRAGFFDAILMDIRMPVMDGYEATRQIRKLEEPNKANMPIIALSANVFETEQRAAKEAGMDAYIVKPIKMENLLEILHVFLA